jgi:hypothetical protein
MADDEVIKEARVLEEGESEFDESEEESEQSSDEGTTSPRCPPELYFETDVPGLNLRFSVGDEVLCNMGHGRTAAGEVVKRFYREREWTRGYYAAVRDHRFEPRICPGHAFAAPNN